MSASLVGSEMCIRDSPRARPLAQHPGPSQAQQANRATVNPTSAEFKTALFWRASLRRFGLWGQRALAR
eukprot:426214-Alexandrium_andersonii.AAC.1